MAIDIKYSGSGLQPVSVNIPTNKLGSVIASAGEQLTAISDEKERKKKVARDNMYIATKSIEARDALSNLEKSLTKDRQDYTGYAKEYTKGAEAVYQKIIDDAPSDEARDLLVQSYAAQRNSLANAADKVETDQLTNQYEVATIASLNQSANELQSAPDKYKSVVASTDILMEAARGALPLDVYETLQTHRKALLAGAMLDGLIRSDIGRAKQIIASGSLDSLITPVQKLGYSEAIEREERSKAAEKSAMQTALKTQHVEQLKLDYYDGKANEADIRSDPNLDAGDVLTILKSGEERIAKKEKLVADTDYVANIQAGNINPDPSVPTNVNSVDNVYENSFLPSIQGLTPEGQMSAVIDYAVKSKMIPTKLLNTLTGNIKSGTIIQAVANADILNSILDKSPSAADQITESVQARSVSLSSMKEAGVPDEQIQNLLNQPPMETNSSLYKARQQEVSAFLLDKETFSTDGFVSPDWFDTNALPGVGEPGNYLIPGVDEPELPEVVNTEFQRILSSVALSSPGMPMEEAAKAARRILLGTWGKSEAGGNKVMKYPPEKYYNIAGVDDAWIAETLKSDFKRAAPNKDPDEDMFLMNSGSFTANRQPTYTVMTYDKFGILAPVIKNWTPKLGNYKGTEIKSAVEKQKAMIDRVRKEQDSVKAGVQRQAEKQGKK